MINAVDNEWRRILTRCRRNGVSDVATYIAALVRKGGYPNYYPYRFAEYLMKKGEFTEAGRLLRLARRFGEQNPLIDRLYGNWLWAMGRRKAALKFVTTAAEANPHSCLYNSLSAMHKLVGDSESAGRFLAVAAGLADEELKRAKNRNFPSKGSTQKTGQTITFHI
jgi:hypothetical protein